MRAQTINAEAGFLRGHGTYVRDGVLLASVAGVVQVRRRAGKGRAVADACVAASKFASPKHETLNPKP